MAISNNPTKTRGIEKAWRREINKRWATFTRDTIRELRAVGGFTVNNSPGYNHINVSDKLKQINALHATPVKNMQEVNEIDLKIRSIMDECETIMVNAFEADPSQLRAYIAFFQEKIDELLLGTWQEKYQRRAYNLAITRANAALRRQGARLKITTADRALAARIQTFTATASLGITAIDLAAFPLHQETLEFLFTRSFEALEGLTVDLARQVRIILFNGVEQGLGIAELTRQIRDRINVSRSRARLIAQTEIIQAFQRGTINQSQLASEFIGEEVKLRWDTRRDSRVRPLHVEFHGQIMTQAEARKKINISPFRCRCGLSPIIMEADTPELRSQLAEERRQLIALAA